MIQADDVEIVPAILSHRGTGLAIEALILLGHEEYADVPDDPHPLMRARRSPRQRDE